MISALCIYSSGNFFPVFTFSYKSILSSVLACIGLGLITLSAGLFKKFQTTINPLKPENASYLVTTKTFKLSRNPMYLGMLILLIAASIQFNPIGGFLICAGFISFITLYQIIPEEEAMHNLFGQEFKDYSNKTRRWI
jgi:protein-S-isoprenylcysteine O-methyltransferase Ste14